MNIEPLVIQAQEFSENEKEEVLQLQKLIPLLNIRNIQEEIAIQIDERIRALNSFKGSRKQFVKKIKSSKKAIFELLQKNLGLVPKMYYTNLWMPLGMSVFGLPIGVVLSAITHNVAFIGIGLPIGLALGSLYGKHLDKKAEEEHKVLNLS